MGIQLTQADTITNVSYNRIHMVKLEIIQHHQLTDAAPSVYDITVSYRYYGVDDEGVRHYKGVGTHTIKDFVNVAYQKHAEGDSLFLQTFGLVQEAVAKIVMMHTGVETVTY